jgi:hypothetical protein
MRTEGESSLQKVVLNKKTQWIMSKESIIVLKTTELYKHLPWDSNPGHFENIL